MAMSPPCSGRCARSGSTGVAAVAGAARQADPCPDRRAHHRTGRQVGDRAPAQRGDRLAFAGRGARLGEVDEDELYPALDLLGAASRRRKVLAQRHLKDGMLVLYDVTSSYLEGRCCELARFGYSRDHRRDRPQIVFGLLCTPTAARSPSRSSTAIRRSEHARHSVRKLKKRFRLKRIVLVGDRGMITSAASTPTSSLPGSIGSPRCARPPSRPWQPRAGRCSSRCSTSATWRRSAHTIIPAERLVVCRNPALAAERARKRDDLLAASEKDLAKVQAATTRARNPLRGAAEIALKAGAVLGRRKVAKHFRLTITEETLGFVRNDAAIAREATLDGFYVLRTSAPAEALDASATVLAYKSLAHVERAFRSLKSIDLDIRPVHHRLAGRVRAHVFLCMLAYYVQWQMRRKLAPLLFEDHDRPAAAVSRASPVARAQVSPAARAKARTRKTDDGEPAHSCRTLLADLATLTRNTVRFGDNLPMIVLSRPTPIQQRAFDLLGVALAP